MAKEIEEVIDYAKGNFFPTSNLLKHALVVAKKLDDEEFAEFISQELKGYKNSPLPAHRKVRGHVIIIPQPFGSLQYVSLHDLDVGAERKVSLAYVAETVPIIENTLNSQGDGGIFVVGFNPENKGILPPLLDSREEYGILLQNSQLKELLDDVRTIVLDWAIKREREITAQSETHENPMNVSKSKRSPFRYLMTNKQWIFSGIGVLALSLLIGVIVHVVRWANQTVSPTQTATGLATQREILEVPKLGDYEVFYPRPFNSVPNLNFNKKIGSLYVPSEYEVLEQRKDGFKIRMLSIGDGRAIEWIATGPTN